jgi:hypothetical protein
VVSLASILGGASTGQAGVVNELAQAAIKGAIGSTQAVVGSVIGDVVAPFSLNNVSAWGGLSKHLMATFYACDSTGVFQQQDAQLAQVTAPINEVNFETTLNWQSPFENAGPESKAPALMALIQSGQIAPILNALQGVPGVNAVTGGTLNGLANSAKETANELQGRTGITRLNSRQVFSGMPPIKISMIVYFRAVQSSYSEVMEPYKQLLRWALPKMLANDGVLTEVAKNAADGGSFIKGLFPSDAPTMVGFTYANNRYAPMVIESLSNPLDGPMDVNGQPIYRAVQMTLATLTALDRGDVAKLFV